MDDRTFEGLTRRAAAVVSRRGSLRTLSAAALALGVAGPVAASAKQGGKKNDRCKKQVSRCKEGLAELCDVVFPPKEAFSTSDCFDAFGGCCEFLSDCSVAQAFACAVEVIENLEEK
jgi:hypothetical protein